MRFRLALLFSMFILACEHKAPTPPGNSNEMTLPQWPMFAGNMRNTSNATDDLQYYPGPERGEIIWSHEFSEIFFSSPSIGPDGTIYIASSICDCVDADSGFVYAFNPDGSTKWRFRTQNSNFSTGAVGLDGTYYFGSLDGNLYAITRDGDLKWKEFIYHFDAEFARPAIAKNGEIIVNGEKSIVALSPATGEIIWRRSANVGDGFGVSIDQSGSIYSGTSNSLLALHPGGTLKWEYPLRYGPAEVVIGFDGTIYFNVSNDTLIYAIASSNGALKWTFSLDGRASINRPGIGPDGSIYAINAHRPAKIYKITPLGKLEWAIELASIADLPPDAYFDTGNSVPMIDRDENIYITISRTGGDNFFSINPKGKVNWSVYAPGRIQYAKPAFSPDGTIYLAGGSSIIAIQ